MSHAFEWDLFSYYRYLLVKKTTSVFTFGIFKILQNTATDCSDEESVNIYIIFFKTDAIKLYSQWW